MNADDSDAAPPFPPHRAGDEDLTLEEEQEVRARARERLLVQEQALNARDEARQAERQRRSETERFRWQVVEEETERFHRERGRVRYVSTTGQVLWLTPEDISLRRSRRVRGRRKGRSGRVGRTGNALAHTLRAAGVSLMIVLGIILVLAAAVYVAEFA